jgi:hypothetical protein
VGPSGSALVADDHVVVDHVVAMETYLLVVEVVPTAMGGVLSMMSQEEVEERLVMK